MVLNLLVTLCTLQLCGVASKYQSSLRNAEDALHSAGTNLPQYLILFVKISTSSH